MGCWYIYCVDAERACERLGRHLDGGQLVEVTEVVPDAGRLERDGLAAGYFGADAPDLSALAWSPTSLGFVQRAEPEAGRSQRECVRRRVEALERLGWKRWRLREWREWGALVLTLLADVALGRDARGQMSDVRDEMTRRY
jgi:hypothetical protein